MAHLRLPDLFTLGNLLCGLIALACTSQRAWTGVLIAMIVGAVCDVLDGALARLLRSDSAMGKELDSLADLITFGVVPALALYYYVRPLVGALPYHPEARYLMLILPFVLPLLAAWRLARFNVESGREGSLFFSGMPTPFQGLFWAVWIYAGPTGIWLHPALWCTLIGVVGFMMVSRWPFLSLKKPQAALPWLASLALWTATSLYLFSVSTALPVVTLGYALISGAAFKWERKISAQRPLQDSNLRPSG